MNILTKKMISLIIFAFIFQQISAENNRFLQTCAYTCSNPNLANALILGSASYYAVLAGSTTTNAGSTTIIGSLGVSPSNKIAGTAVTLTCGEFHAADGNSLAAQNDLTAAYNYLAGAPAGTDMTGKDLGGLTLPAGNYGFTTSAFITGNLILDANFNPNAQWIFQISTTLITSVGAQVTVINGGSNLNVYWQVGTSATINDNSVMVGNILAYASIALGTAVNLSGRALARSGGVTMLSNVVSRIPCL